MLVQHRRGKINAHVGVAQGNEDLEDACLVGFRLGVSVKSNHWCASIRIIKNFNVTQRRRSTL
jgi:hypothetical protein